VPIDAERRLSGQEPGARESALGVNRHTANMLRSTQQRR